MSNLGKPSHLPADLPPRPSTAKHDFADNTLDRTVNRAVVALQGCYAGVVPILAATLLSFTLTVAAWPHLDRVTSYPDPSAGVITLLDVSKTPDFVAPILFITLALLLSLAIGSLFHVLARDEESPAVIRTSLSSALLLSLVPALFRLTNACVVPAATLPPLKVLALFPCAALLGMALLLRYRRALTPTLVTQAIGAVLIIFLFATFTSFALLLAISRFIDPAHVASLGQSEGLIRNCALGLAAALVLGSWVWSATGEAFGRNLLRAAVLSQAGIPLFLLHLVPPAMLSADGTVLSTVPQGLRTTLLAISALCILWGIRQVFVVRSLASAVRTSSVVSILVFLYVSHGQLPTISHDFFHSGEQIVPWQQVRDFHKVPFVDFAPIHGLLELMIGVVNQIFFDGTVAHYWPSVALMVGLSAAALGVAGSALLTPLGALIFILACPPYLDRMYFVAPAIFVLALPRLLIRPAAFLWFWAAIVTLSTLYSPTVGPALVLASVPLILWQLIRLYRLQGVNATGFHLAVVGLIPLTLLVISPARKVMVAFVHFVLDNAWTNTVANATPWSLGAGMRNPTTGIGSTQFGWEIIRFAWIPFALTAAVVLWREIARPLSRNEASALPASETVPLARRSHLIVLALLAIGLVLFVGPWSLGRIDPGAPSRAWAISQCAISFLLPAIVLLAASPRAKAAAIAFLSVGLGLVYGNAQMLDTDTMVNRATLPIVLPAGTEFIDGAAYGMPNIGHIIKPDFLPELVHTKKVFDALLEPGAPYLDLTNRQALYCYLGRPAPVMYPAYVAANSKLQSRMAAQLKENPVDVVAVSPAANFDGLSCSIRCYRIYRDYALSFVAVARDEFIFLVSPSRIPGIAPGSTEEQLSLLDSAFLPGPLQGIPHAWGRSWKTLASRFSSVAILTPQPSADGSVITCPLPPSITSGVDADFLHLRLTYPGNYGTAMEVRWLDNAGKLSAPISFSGRRGDLVVPLGAHPRWLLGKAPRELQIRLVSPPKDPSKLELHAILLKLKDL